MQRLRGVAHCNDPRADGIGTPEPELERMMRPRPGLDEPTEPPTEARAERGEEVLTVRLRESRCAIRAHGPDEREFAAGEWEQREWPLISEALERDALPDDLGAHARDDRGLAIVPEREIVTGELASVREHEQPRRDFMRRPRRIDSDANTLALRTPTRHPGHHAFGGRRFERRRCDRAG